MPREGFEQAGDVNVPMATVWARTQRGQEGEVGDELEQDSQPRLFSAIPWEVTRSSGLILKGRRGGWRIGNDWGDCCSSLVAPREGVG